MGGKGTDQALYLHRPLTQVGKFAGAFPFVVEASGLYRGLPVSQRVTIPDDYVATSDTTLAAWWTGRQIQALEQTFQTNAVVSEIIDHSLRARVLSLYTAFLALEPGQGGQVCYDCFDETDGIRIGTEDEVPAAPTTTTLQAYPNPFSATVTIVVTLAEPVDAATVTLQIYNMMGQVARTLPLGEAGRAGQFEVTWDGTCDTGEAVASAAYLVVLATPAGRHTLTLVRVR